MMMKKLLIFMLVLGLASVANATIEFSWDAGAALPGADLTIELVADAGEQVSMVMLAIVTDNGFGGTATPGTWNPGFTLATDPGYNGAAFGYGIGDLLGASGEADAGDSATGLLYSYTYGIPGTATVGHMINFAVEDVPGFGLVSEVVFLDGRTMVPGNFDVTIIPEPMTVVLLGLGGLFLRRRNRKK